MSQKWDDENNEGGGTQTLTRPKVQTKPPAYYKVLLLNDDFTPMDFVTHILEKFFRKAAEEATRVMLQVHHKGAGVAGVYSYEVAETKCLKVNEYAKANQYPLKCTIEKA